MQHCLLENISGIEYVLTLLKEPMPGTLPTQSPLSYKMGHIHFPLGKLFLFSSSTLLFIFHIGSGSWWDRVWKTEQRSKREWVLEASICWHCGYGIWEWYTPDRKYILNNENVFRLEMSKNRRAMPGSRGPSFWNCFRGWWHSSLRVPEGNVKREINAMPTGAQAINSLHEFSERKEQRCLRILPHVQQACLLGNVVFVGGGVSAR